MMGRRFTRILLFSGWVLLVATVCRPAAEIDSQGHSNAPNVRISNRIDKAFWNGRAVWLDASVMQSARSEGRAYPPIPFKDPDLGEYHATSDVVRVTGSPDDTVGRREMSDPYELAFWSKWTRLLPKPPEVIEAEQKKRAVAFFEYDQSYQRYLESVERMSAPPRPVPRKNAGHRLRDMQDQVETEGFPYEAFTSNSLSLAYLHAVRAEYQQRVEAGLEAEGRVSVEFQKRVAVAGTQLMSELSQDEIDASLGWKKLYLRRLLREGIADEYVRAYCAAWGLSEADLADLERSAKAPMLVEKEENGPRREDAVSQDHDKKEPNRRTDHRVNAIQILLRRGGDINLRKAEIYADRWGLDLAEIRASFDASSAQSSLSLRKLQEVRRLVRDATPYSMHQAGKLADDIGVDLEAIVREESKK